MRPVSQGETQYVLSQRPLSTEHSSLIRNNEVRSAVWDSPQHLAVDPPHVLTVRPPQVLTVDPPQIPTVDPPQVKSLLHS